MHRIQYRNTTIELHNANITQLRNVDAIVNAANERLTDGAGVCGAIHTAAGRELLGEACMRFPVLEARSRVRCPIGQAKTTGAFGLEAQGIRRIIHTPGPDLRNPENVSITREPSRQDIADVGACYTSVLREAEANRLTSIAIPAISCGIFGFPRNQGTTIAVDSIKKYFDDHRDSGIRRVILCVYDSDAAVTSSSISHHKAEMNRAFSLERRGS
jgi:O-acetyl-ADP-ribose deacetylase (regulator of RNase III)